jgi:hypothetical protein
MSEMATNNIVFIRSYLRALASGQIGAELAKYFNPDAIQIEFPNKFNPNGNQSDLATIIARSEKGRTLVDNQSYQVTSEISDDSQVAIEAIWTGHLAVAVGSLPAGSTMRAYFSIHFEMRDGRIAVQRNYDCFDPW